jgi:hypothetical protein
MIIHDAAESVSYSAKALTVLTSLSLYKLLWWAVSSMN